jgi:hypothetical protein
MAKFYTWRYLFITLAGLLLLALAANNQTVGAHPTGAGVKGGPAAQKQQTTLDQLVWADGTLDLSRGYQGSVDTHGWQMVTAPGQAPRFVPAGTQANAAGVIRPAVAGDENWDNRFGITPLSGPVYAMALVGSDLYVGGDFLSAGGTVVNNIARWNGSSWSALGGGITGTRHVVEAMAVNGTDLYVGGWFSTAGGITVNNVARWNGSQWAALDNGTNGEVFALGYSNSRLYVGGSFGLVGSTQIQAAGIAQWNGSQWSSVGGSLQSLYTDVYALAVSGNDLYIGGNFLNAGGVQTDYIAHWNGSQWAAVGGGVSSTVTALALDGANLYAGGGFSVAGSTGVHGIAKWNGTTWSALGNGVSGTVRALTAFGGNVYAGGSFTIAGTSGATNIARWNGSSWAGLGNGTDAAVRVLANNGTTLYAGGLFLHADSAAVSYSAQWNGSQWSPVGLARGGQGMDGIVYALTAGSGSVYAGGSFANAGQAAANEVARWNGSSWTALGSGLRGQYSSVNALAVSGTTLYAGGVFTDAGGVAVNNIAKWDGSQWSALGSGVSGGVNALAVSGGDLYVGGSFATAGGLNTRDIAKWNGSAWSTLGGAGFTDSFGGPNSYVLALAVNGSDLYATGNFGYANGVATKNIAKWNGSAWSALGSGLSDGTGSGNDYGQGRALAMIGSNLYAGGYFATAGGTSAVNIAKWNGSSWSALGSGLTGATGSLPTAYSLATDGTNLFVGGNFTAAGGVPAINIAKWDGSQWAALGSGTDNIVQALVAVNSDLYAGGNFIVAGGNASNYLGEWHGFVGTPTMTTTPLPPAPTITPVPSATVCPIQYTDVPVGSTFYDFVKCLACRGIVGGYSDDAHCPGGTPCFQVSANVTRGQMAKFIANAAGYSETIPPTQQTFSDVPPGSTFWLYVERAALHGVIGGYSDGTFKPSNPVTRGQTAKFVANASAYVDTIPPDRQTYVDVPSNDTFWIYVERVSLHSIVGGYSDGTFRPSNGVTRGQTTKFIGNAFFPGCQTALR